jgi:hypothetical protein
VRSLRVLAAVTFLATACGGEKSEPKMETKADALPAPAAPPASPTISDATTKNADTLKPGKGDTATKKAEGPLRDSAFGPKFTVDSTGKVTPIKKRP